MHRESWRDEHYKGDIDDVKRLYLEQLSPAEIARRLYLRTDEVVFILNGLREDGEII